MIVIDKLKSDDIGRNVIYHREFCNGEVGKLTSWNHKFVFVQFKGPNGEACEPADVTFENDRIIDRLKNDPSMLNKIKDALTDEIVD